jgi:hypothetical protein
VQVRRTRAGTETGLIGGAPYVAQRRHDRGTAAEPPSGAPRDPGQRIVAPRPRPAGLDGTGTIATVTSAAVAGPTAASSAAETATASAAPSGATRPERPRSFTATTAERTAPLYAATA